MTRLETIEGYALVRLTAEQLRSATGAVALRRIHGRWAGVVPLLFGARLVTGITRWGWDDGW